MSAKIRNGAAANGFVTSWERESASLVEAIAEAVSKFRVGLRTDDVRLLAIQPDVCAVSDTVRV